MRSLIPVLLIALACALAGCAADQASPATAFAGPRPAAGPGPIVVAQKPAGGADDLLHENCGGR